MSNATRRISCRDRDGGGGPTLAVQKPVRNGQSGESIKSGYRPLEANGNSKNNSIQQTKTSTESTYTPVILNSIQAEGSWSSARASLKRHNG